MLIPRLAIYHQKEKHELPKKEKEREKKKKEEQKLYSSRERE
jgi:uncharacterized membrane protein